MACLINEILPGDIRKENDGLFNGMDLSSKRLVRTVDMILNYSRLQVGEFPLYRKHFSLPALCTNLVTELTASAKHKSLELTFKNNCGDVDLFTDEYSMTLAISNIIDNAIKYTDKGYINLILRKDGIENIILDIKDTGIGIKEENLKRIFEPYQQEQMGYGRAYEGVGLGLSIVKKILDLNNVVITVKSKKGEGSIFSINFGKEQQTFPKTGKTGN